MDVNSLAIATSPCDDSCPSFDVVWSVGDTVATLTKSDGLFDPETEYTVTVSAMDVAANHMTSIYEWSFSTYIPLVLTEVTPIPTRTTSINPVYYFSTNEDAADYGELQYMSERCGNETHDGSEVLIDSNLHTFTIKGAKPGNTYECSFQLASTLRGTSNLLKVGPFTVIRKSSSGYISKKVPTIFSTLVTTTPAVSDSSLEKKVPELTQLYKLKSSGDIVVKIQQALNAKNAQPKLLEDGKYGMKTFLAVKKFQAEKGVGVDGIVGNDTWKLLNQ